MILPLPRPSSGGWTKTKTARSVCLPRPPAPPCLRSHCHAGHLSTPVLYPAVALLLLFGLRAQRAPPLPPRIHLNRTPPLLADHGNRVRRVLLGALPAEAARDGSGVCRIADDGRNAGVHSTACLRILFWSSETLTPGTNFGTLTYNESHDAPLGHRIAGSDARAAPRQPPGPEICQQKGAV